MQTLQPAERAHRAAPLASSAIALAIVLTGVRVAGADGAKPASELEADVANAKPAPPTRRGPIDVLLGYSYDTRDFTTFNITTFTGRLPLGFSIWGFADISSPHNAGSSRFDMSRHFMEYRFRWSPKGALKRLGLEAEYNDASGPKNSVVRGGATYFLPIPIGEGSWVQLRTLPMQSRGRSSQFSVIHNIWFAKRVSLMGFSDLNVPWDGSDARVIAESQLTYHITPVLGVGVEARYNGFEDAAPDVDGYGLGLALMASL